MKSKIMKILVIVAAALFLSASVSMAHDWKRGHDKPRVPAYGSYKKGHDHPPGWHKVYFDRYRHVPRFHRKPGHAHRYYPYFGSYPAQGKFFFSFTVTDPNFGLGVGVRER